MAPSYQSQLARSNSGLGFIFQSRTVKRHVGESLNKTPIYQVPPPPPQPVPIIKNPVIRKLQEETLPSLSITSSIEQDSVLGMDRRPEKEGNALFYP